MCRQNSRGRYEKGAVSLFVVIFTSLLVTVVTVGFANLMIRTQQQATQNDLSQSAYDSALAGVEDAKRILLLNQQCNHTGSAGGLNCSMIESAINSQECNSINAILGGAVNEEKIVQRAAASDDQALDQAYTCVKIALKTADYRRQALDQTKSHMIPLKTESGQSFDSITIRWFTKEDAFGSDADGNLNLPTNSEASSMNLPQLDSENWPVGRPPVLRAQLMQFNQGSFTLDQFNAAGGPQTNSSTVFLYPAPGNGSSLLSSQFDLDVVGAPKTPVPAKCSSEGFSDSRYACAVKLSLPQLSGGGTTREAYLRLSSIYNKTSYQIVLNNGSNTVIFDAVQPEVDSTGRANDLFRRIKARVQLQADFPYPESTVDLNGSFCKDMFITESIETSSDECTVPTVDDGADE